MPLQEDVEFCSPPYDPLTKHSSYVMDQPVFHSTFNGHPIMYASMDTTPVKRPYSLMRASRPQMEPAPHAEDYYSPADFRPGDLHD